MIHRGRAANTFVLVLSTVALVASCSAEEDAPSPPAPSLDADASDAAMQQDATVEAAADGPVDVTSHPDAAQETSTQLCAEGSWGNIPNTKCDVIEQDCAPTLTCYPNVMGGNPGTSCTFLGNGLKLRGARCDSSQECSSGLICAANYCTPFCCPERQFEICGPGARCSINLTISASHQVMICSYGKPCTLWINDCAAGEACILASNDGSAECSLPAKNEFVGEGQACTALNDCGDAMVCMGSGLCRYLCKRGQSPYDAGAPDAQPGQGGCPTGQTCQALQGQPEWLGACTP